MKLFRTRTYLADAGREIDFGVIGRKVLLSIEIEKCQFPDWTILLQIGSVGLFYVSLSLGHKSYTMTVLGRNYG
jgi:hypothetical protein